MKIVQASIYRQFQHFVDGEYRCRGQSETGFDSTLVCLRTDTDLTGWGEVAPLGSFYSAAFAAGARAGLGELLPGLIGADPREIARVNRYMDFTLAGHPYVKTPIDMACWDLLGQDCGLSLAEQLGGRYSESTPLYRSVSQADPDDMAALALAYVEHGYRRIQVKVGDDPVADAERMRAVRSAVGADVLLLADANGAWTVDQALRFVNAMGADDYYLEQPCMLLDENIAVRRHCGQPMILDESIESLQDLQRAAGRGFSGITIKLSRVGGITAARLIRDLALSLGMKICIEDTGGSDIDTAATALMMVSMPPERQMHSVDFMNWVVESNASGMPQTRDGLLYAPTGPGLGLRVDAASFGEPIAEFG